jgi:hypothetical protein
MFMLRYCKESQFALCAKFFFLLLWHDNAWHSLFGVLNLCSVYTYINNN